MTLLPLRQRANPKYPKRRGGETSFGRWLRRSLTAGFASGALLFGGCSGVASRSLDENTTEDNDLVIIFDVLVEQPPVTTPDEEISPGGMPAPDHEYDFNCPGEELWFWPSPPTTIDGYLCDDSPSVANVNIIDDGRYEVALSLGAAFVVLIDPGGEEVAELDPESRQVEVDMTAGQWSVSATAADPINEPFGFIAVDITPVEH